MVIQLPPLEIMKRLEIPPSCMLGKHCKVDVCDVNAGVAFTGRIINIWPYYRGDLSTEKKKINKGMNEIKREEVKKPNHVGTPAVLLSPGAGGAALHKCFAQPFKGISELSCQLEF